MGVWESFVNSELIKKALDWFDNSSNQSGWKVLCFAADFVSF